MMPNVDNPLVSILVPVYNVEYYIERCARSVLGQTYPFLEFVFVDDGCTDSSITVLERVVDEYPSKREHTVIIHHQQNRGLAVARNTALNNCHGDYVLHVDSDDWIEPNTVELLINRQTETGADIVYTTGYYCETQETVKCDNHGWCSEKESLFVTFLQGNAASCIWGKLIKRRLYTDHGILCYEQGSYYEGFQTLSRLIYYSQIISCLDAYLYHYDRLNPNSIVTNVPNSIEIQRQGLLSILGVCDFFQGKEQCYYDKVKRFYVSFIYRMLIINCRCRNQKGYKEFLGLIEKVDRNDWSLIGWNRPWKRMIDRNYFMKKMFYMSIV